jgi:hypothetical protein
MVQEFMAELCIESEEASGLAEGTILQRLSPQGGVRRDAVRHADPPV